MTEKNYSELQKEVAEILREQRADTGYPDLKLAHELIPEAKSILTSKDLGPRLLSWPAFDSMFGAFRPREFTVLCGTSGTGKTSLLANMSMHLMAGNVPHFVASVETGAADYFLRVTSVLESRDLNTGEQLEEAEVDAIFEKWNSFYRRRMATFSPYVNKTDHRRVLCDLLHARQAFGCRVAFVDNLNFLMPIVSSGESMESMDRIVHDFIIFCKNVDMHVVMVMHPRKREGRDGSARVENEYDIKGSSTVIQEAHNVLLFNRTDRNDERFVGGTFRELKFAKLRRRGRFIGNSIRFECKRGRYFEIAEIGDDDERKSNAELCKKIGRYGPDA